MENITIPFAVRNSCKISAKRKNARAILIANQANYPVVLIYNGNDGSENWLSNEQAQWYVMANGGVKFKIEFNDGGEGDNYIFISHS